AVLARGLGPIVETVAVAWQDGLGPERVHATLDRLTAHLARHSHLARLLQRALLEESPAVQALLERWIGSLYREGIAVVRKAARDAGWEAEQVPHLGVALFGMIFAYFTNATALRRLAGWGDDLFSARARSPSSVASSSRRSSGCSGRARGPVHGGPMADTEHGHITDEGIAKLRARIGQGFPGRRPWRTEVTRDAIYHLALAIGDLSPLYLDEDYARKTRWGTLIAPPIIVQTMDTLRAVGHSGLPEGLPGVHSIWTGSLYEWERVVKLGDRLRADCYLKSLTEKESSFGGGRALYQTYEAVYYDQ